ncbi:hypothetical protein AC249_AIPGENE4210 [Exaiptasia diaphana]|nr:hypothetical protein AC249_AIPGENE4210 [Exaiptasia diaphana]
MPEDAITRRSLETIKNKTYSISSDVWSFCLLCYELYEAYDNRDQPCQPIDCEPIKCEIEKIVAYLESNNRPEKPKSMPDWLYIAVKQGLLYKPEERPPPILLRDCLTYRKPFESCLLSRWKKYHPDLIVEHNVIDVEVEQPSIPEYEHVIPPGEHIPFDELQQMSSVAVFMNHSYKYAPGNELADVDDNEELYEDIHSPAYVNIGRDIGERRVRDVTYDEVVRQQLPSSQPTRPPSTPSPKIVGKPPPRPPKSDHCQAIRRPAPYPRRLPLQTLPSNESRHQSINDEVLYVNMPFVNDMAREMAGQHDNAEERSWHSWNSSTPSPRPSRPPSFQDGAVRGDDPGIG